MDDALWGVKGPRIDTFRKKAKKGDCYFTGEWESGILREDVMIAFLVSVLAFWCPVNVPSLVLAAVGLVVCYIQGNGCDWGRSGCGMKNRCMMVSEGVSGGSGLIHRRRKDPELPG